MVERLSAVRTLRSRWKQAVELATEGRVAPAVQMEKPPTARAFHFKRTLRYLVLQAFYTFMGAGSQVLRGEVRTDNLRGFLLLLAIGSGLGFIVALPRLIKAFVLWCRHLPVDGSLRQIALALCDALCTTDHIKTNRRRLEVNTQELQDGSWSASLMNAEFYEQALFADCLSELLGSIENPRYLITREERRLGRNYIDYHAVPAVLGTRKKQAAVFHAAWNTRVGAADLIYTRTQEGRRDLLKARARAFSTAAADKTRRMDRWQ